MGVFGIVAIGAVATVAVVWLAVSFMTPGRGRTLLEWLGATGLYVALASLFTYLFLQSRESGSLAGQIGFGLLLLVFASGLLVTLAQLVASLKPPRSSSTSTTN